MTDSDTLKNAELGETAAYENRKLTERRNND